MADMGIAIRVASPKLVMEEVLREAADPEQGRALKQFRELSGTSSAALGCGI